MDEKQLQEKFLDALVEAGGSMQKVLERGEITKAQVAHWTGDRKFFKAMNFAMERAALLHQAELMLEQRVHTAERTARLNDPDAKEDLEQRQKDFEQSIKAYRLLQTDRRLSLHERAMQLKERTAKAKAAAAAARAELEQIGPRAHPDVPPARVKQLLDEMERVDRYCG
jgi:hypothetical protein